MDIYSSILSDFYRYMEENEDMRAKLSSWRKNRGEIAITMCDCGKTGILSKVRSCEIEMEKELVKYVLQRFRVDKINKS